MERIRIEYTTDNSMYVEQMPESVVQELIEKEMAYKLAQKIIKDSSLTIKKESIRDGLETKYSAEVFIGDESQYRKLVDNIKNM